MRPKKTEISYYLMMTPVAVFLGVILHDVIFSSINNFSIFEYFLSCVIKQTNWYSPMKNCQYQFNFSNLFVPTFVVIAAISLGKMEKFNMDSMKSLLKKFFK